jgi:hypothetical protein
MRRINRNSGAKASGGNRKERRTFTLSRESVELLNDLRVARKNKRQSVSAVLDDLLRALDRQRKRETIDRAISNYYDGLSERAHAEDKAWGEFSLAQFMDGTD